VSKAVGSTTTVFVHAGDETIAEYDNGTLRLEYVMGAGVDEALGLVVGGQRYYLSRNHLGSVAAITDSTRAVRERYRYDAYGARTTVASGPTGNPIGFTGRHVDSTTGLLYFRSRWYSPRLGRFMSRDVDGTSLYAAYFVPTFRDPSGMCGVFDPLDCAKKIGNGLKAAGNVGLDLLGDGKDFAVSSWDGAKGVAETAWGGVVSVFNSAVDKGKEIGNTAQEIWGWLSEEQRLQYVYGGLAIGFTLCTVIPNPASLPCGILAGVFTVAATGAAASSQAIDNMRKGGPLTLDAGSQFPAPDGKCTSISTVEVKPLLSALGVAYSLTKRIIGSVLPLVGQPVPGIPMLTPLGRAAFGAAGVGAGALLSGTNGIAGTVRTIATAGLIAGGVTAATHLVGAGPATAAAIAIGIAGGAGAVRGVTGAIGGAGRVFTDGALGLASSGGNALVSGVGSGLKALGSLF
jgi:RHS repeat-associated protein